MKMNRSAASGALSGSFNVRDVEVAWFIAIKLKQASKLLLQRPLNTDKHSESHKYCDPSKNSPSF